MPHRADSRVFAPPLSMSVDNQNIVIIGGGVAGLSVAHYLATTSDLKVTLLECETPEQQRNETTSGSFSAAGALDVQLAGGGEGELLSMCHKSREMYDDWVNCVEEGAKAACNGEGGKYLWDVPKDKGDEALLSSLEPWEVGYLPDQGWLAPVSDIESTANAQFDSSKTVKRVNTEALELEPLVNPDVKEWYWSPSVATIDARRLTCSLRAACTGAGVQMNFGEEWAVESLAMEEDGRTCKGLNLAKGKYLSCDTVVVANGSFLNDLMEDVVPVVPSEAQSLIVRMSENENTAPMKRAVYNYDVYVVPKADGRILVGATTIEPGLTNGNDTDDSVLSHAKKLVPRLRKSDIKIEERFAGLRPMTRDSWPILGETDKCDNVYISGGYNTYGILLAPKAGKLIGDLIIENGLVTEEDRTFLKAFSPNREHGDGSFSICFFAP